MLCTKCKVAGMEILILTVDEAAARYGVNASTIRTLISRGTLRSHRVNGRVHVEAGQVKSMVEKKCPGCLDYFRPKNARQRFCSDACRKRAHRAKQ
ncbi:MAG: helix-turn-helix domain-containing protein [Spartobacteria bacterium]|nr:helix-turn-helix domain-containing protein [Spartobacteria bacterium]